MGGDTDDGVLGDVTNALTTKIDKDLDETTRSFRSFWRSV